MSYRVKKMLLFERWSYFNPSYRKPWIKVVKTLINFIIFGLIFSIAFAFIEKASLGGNNFLENLGNSAYYFFTSISTIGYGDISPRTPLGKILFILCITFYGVYKIVNLVELIVQARQYRLKLKEKGRLFMAVENHVIAFFDVKSLCRYNFLFLERFINENLNSNKFMNSPLFLVNACHDTKINEELSLFLQENSYFNEKVTLINADIYEHNLFDKIYLNKAEHIYILSESELKMTSDSKVIDTVLRIRNHGYTSNNISAELIDDSMRHLLQSKNVMTIIRPTRSYPELIVRASVAEGSEKMLEELLSSKGDSIATFKVNKSELLWGDLLYKLSMAGIGTAMGYIKNDGTVDPNPKGTDFISDISKILIIIEGLENKDFLNLERKINQILSE